MIQSYVEIWHCLFVWPPKQQWAQFGAALYPIFLACPAHTVEHHPRHGPGQCLRRLLWSATSSPCQFFQILRRRNGMACPTCGEVTLLHSNHSVKLYPSSSWSYIVLALHSCSLRRIKKKDSLAIQYTSEVNGMIGSMFFRSWTTNVGSFKGSRVALERIL